jgi:hypothetical protein
MEWNGKANENEDENENVMTTRAVPVLPFQKWGMCDKATSSMAPKPPETHTSVNKMFSKALIGK